MQDGDRTPAGSRAGELRPPLSTAGRPAGLRRPRDGGILSLCPHRRPGRGGERAGPASSGPPGSTSPRSCRSTAPCATSTPTSSRSGQPFLVPIGGRTEEARVFRVAGATGRARRSSSSSTSTTSTGRASTARTRWTIPTTPAASPSSRWRRSPRCPGWCRDRCCSTRTTGTPRWSPVYLRTTLAAERFAAAATTVLSVHNPGYQGHFPPEVMPEIGLPWELYNWQSARVVRQGELPQGRAGVRRLRHHGEPHPGRGAAHAGRRLRPARRVHLAGATGWSACSTASTSASGTRPPTRQITAQYSAEQLDGKRRCKAALQRSFGLPQRRKVPLFGMTGRLVTQKGLDLILQRDELLATRRAVRLSRQRRAALRARRWSSWPRRRPTGSACSSTSPTGWSTGSWRAPTSSSCRRCTSPAASPRCGRSATARRRSCATSAAWPIRSRTA